MNKKIYTSHDSVKIGLILSMVGGILDSHTFIFRDGVFANTQTGNIVFLALSILNDNLEKTLQFILPMIAFAVGAALTELIKNFLPPTSNFKWVHIILLIEILFLFLIGFVPKDFYNNLVITFISFVCSLQASGFKSLKGSPYATTMCTGNLRSASTNFANFIFKKDKKAGIICLRYLIIILSFFTGALIGILLTQLMGEHTLWICSALLLVAFALINSNE